MNLFAQINWMWPAIALAFSLGVVLTRWWLMRGANKDNQVNQEYFKGLNFLLNEQPDKAIEVFIKALEVDSETVELHLALGGLFRRKGQVDRATRIHQNLIARPSLTEEQRLQSVYELAQDYYKAGLLDRAENLFLELKESLSYRRQAIDGLCEIYQQEKEWSNAIDVLHSHRRADRPKYAKQLSHFWCEMAEQAIKENQFDQARKFLRSSLGEDRSTVRAVMLRGELAYQQEDYAKAMSLWRSSSIADSVLSELVVDKIILCFKAINDRAGLIDYLSNEAAIPRRNKAFILWRETIDELFDDKASIERVLEQLRTEKLSGPVAEFLYDLATSNQLANDDQATLLTDLLKRAQSKKIEYTCIRCGFDTKAMHWHCPNCGEWESFS